MTHPAITTEIHQTLNAHRYRAAQIALNGDLRDFESKQIDLGVGEIFDLDRTGDTGRQTNSSRHRATDTENRSQSDLDMLLIRNINVRYTRHGTTSTLSLLMSRIGANHPHHPLTPHDLAIAAHLFYRRSYLHRYLRLFTCHPGATL